MDKKSIFITGAASGMGLATAKLFHDKGWFVAGYDVDEVGLASLADILGDNGMSERLDVTDRAAYKEALARFSQRTDGQLDLLFNNAGIGEGGLFTDMEFEAVERVIQVNLMGVLIGIHCASDMLKATPNSLCFTTSSSSGIFGLPGIAVYSATKHAVKGLTEALSVELAATGSRAADVLPGTIDTAILPDEIKAAAPKEGMWRLMPPEAVAEVVWKAYHDTRIHWYVPDDLAEQERHALENPEGIRDAYLGGGSAFMEGDGG